MSMTPQVSPAIQTALAALPLAIVVCPLGVARVGFTVVRFLDGFGTRLVMRWAKRREVSKGATVYQLGNLNDFAERAGLKTGHYNKKSARPRHG